MYWPNLEFVVGTYGIRHDDESGQDYEWDHGMDVIRGMYMKSISESTRYVVCTQFLEECWIRKTTCVSFSIIPYFPRCWLGSIGWKDERVDFLFPISHLQSFIEVSRSFSWSFLWIGHWVARNVGRGVEREWGRGSWASQVLVYSTLVVVSQCVVSAFIDMNVGPSCNVLSLLANNKRYSTSSSMMYDDVFPWEDREGIPHSNQLSLQTRALVDQGRPWLRIIALYITAPTESETTAWANATMTSDGAFNLGFVLRPCIVLCAT